MRRTIFEPEHEAFRELARTFLAKEVVPHHERWEAAGVVDREVWLAAGKAGLLGYFVDEEYGGGGVKDRRYSAVFTEEAARAGASGPAFGLHNDIIGPYLTDLTDDGQKRRWLPGFCSGEIITAIAMTEPGTGSDLQAVRTSAVRDGDHYVINGSKTFITNGQNANLIIVVCKTDKALGAKGTSLIVVETDALGERNSTPGFRRGRRLDKVGLKSQDTSELFFDGVRVPADNLIGGREGQGFIQLMQQLPQERLQICLSGVAAMERALAETLAYVKERKAFNKAIWEFQNTRFKLAEVNAIVLAARAFVDACMVAHLKGELDAPRAALAKAWVSEQQGKVMDECLQLFGGYGYMMEYPIAELFVNARVQRIYGGTNEIMKELASRSM
jgi:alkylation response protein AidB-like acyl-CoA dehydrogenase